MIVREATVSNPAPGKLRLEVDFDQVDPAAAAAITALAADLKKDAADGRITASEGVQLVGDALAILSPAFGGKFALVAPQLGSALADGKLSRMEALSLALTMAVAFGA